MSNAHPEAHRHASGLDAQAERLRELLDRLRSHIIQSKISGDIALGRLQAALSRIERLPGGASSVIEQAEHAFGREGAELTPEARLRGLADKVLDEQRKAAGEILHQADEVRVMAERLERRLARSDGTQSGALRAVESEVRVLGSRLEARCAQIEDQAAQTLARLADRLALWEVAAERQEQPAADELITRSAQGEAQSGRPIAELLKAMGRRSDEPEPEATPTASAVTRAFQATTPSRSPRQPVDSPRAAVALLSAGIASLGLVTLAIVLEPPPTASTRDLVVTTPRYADEAAVIAPGAATVAEPQN